MPATVHVLARYTAKAGREEDLKTVLTTLVAPSRRELGCYQYDLLRSVDDARDFCFVERWEDDAALDQHAASPHVAAGRAQAEPLVDGPPEIRRYRLL